MAKKTFTYTLNPELLEKFHTICKNNCMDKSKVVDFLIKLFVKTNGNIGELEKLIDSITI